ncbi:SDR family oxidoreductase [Alteromonas sp. MTD1]|uniref:UDP-glucose 4-epimerase family protein n=1 Tax=Alteromonas sp. MTD1 TaxID=3057962 RepID=UPI0036F29159
MATVLVTGASGFVGRHLVDCLHESGADVRVLGRRDIHANKFTFFESNFNDENELSAATVGVDTVVHCAARVHVMQETASDPLSEFRAFNVDATLKLATQAAKNGVKRFIFLSTIKVNGESTTNKAPFTAFDQPRPEDPYGISKAEAEQGLIALAERTGMEYVIIRPPLVYGAGVKANFAALMGLVKKGIPLPFRMIKKNRRSMVSVVNLVDLIRVCTTHPLAKNNVFLVSDDNDVSTSEMVKLMAYSFGMRDRSIPIPPFFFEGLARLLGKKDIVERLTGSLQIDLTHTKGTLGWYPPQSIKNAFEATANNTPIH